MLKLNSHAYKLRHKFSSLFVYLWNELESRKTKAKNQKGIHDVLLLSTKYMIYEIRETIMITQITNPGDNR